VLHFVEVSHGRRARHFLGALTLSQLAACAPTTYELIPEDRSSPPSQAGFGAVSGSAPIVGAGGNTGGAGNSATGGSASGVESTSINLWTSSDIGPVTGSGEALIGNQSILLTTGGGRRMPADHGSEEDAFFLLYRAWAGDVEAVVHLLDSTGQAGVMLREGTESLARYAMAGLRAEQPELVFQYRPVAGQRSPVPRKVKETSAPVWLKLVRQDQQFSAFYSPDGLEWTKIGDPIQLDLARELKLGLFIAFDAPAEARFAELRISVP
jgi:hypothetical protein